MRQTTLLLAFAALAAASCSLQLDSQYGLRWDRRVTAPQRAESETSVDRATAEPEVAPEFYAADSEPQTEAVQALTATGGEDFEAALPFGIQLDDLPEGVAPQVERRLEKLNEQRTATEGQTNKSLARSAGSIVLKIAGVILGVGFMLIGALAFLIGYLISIVDTDEAQKYFGLGVAFLVLGVLFIIIPQFL